MLNYQSFDYYKVILNNVFESFTIRCNFNENGLQILDPDESLLFFQTWGKVALYYTS